MLSLYRLFLRTLGRPTVYYLTGSSLVILFLHRILPFRGELLPYQQGLICLTLITAMVALHYLGTFVTKNSSWMIALPLSKKRLLALNVLTNLTVVAWLAACYFAVLVIVHLAVTGHPLPAHFREAAQSVWHTLREHFRVHQVNEVVPFLLAGLFGTGLLLAVKPSSRPDPRLALFVLRRRHLHRFALALVIVFFLRRYVFCAFGFFALATMGACFFAPATWRLLLALPKPLSRRVFSGALSLTLLCILGCAGWAQYLLRAPSSPQAKVSSLVFLGPYSGEIPRETLARLLETELDARELKELGQRYLTRYHRGGKLSRTEETLLHFDALVVSKTAAGQALAAARFFAADSLGADDLYALFEHLRVLDRGLSYSEYLEFLPARWTRSDRLRFLSSSNLLAIRYALLRARYERDPSAEREIERALPQYPAQLIPVALLTLSLLRGERVSNQALGSVLSGRNLATVFPEVNCAGFLPRSLADLKEKEMGRLNLCLRQRADRKDSGLLQEIEETGWLSPPLNRRQQDLLERVFPSLKG